jgi:Ca2+-binding EF-hand superfamily protein
MSTISGFPGAFAQTGSMRGGGFGPPTFSSLDGDKSGGLSLDELKSALSNASTSSTTTDNQAQALFKVMDADQDGSISESEKNDFDSALQDRMSTLQIMAQIAGQGDDSTEGADGAMMGPGPGGMMGPPPSASDQASDLMSILDGDKSGGASIDEFTSAVTNAAGSDAYSSDDIKSAFSLLDADGDGSLTSTEIESFLQSQQPSQMAFGPPPPADWLQQANSAYAATAATTSAAA